MSITITNNQNSATVTLSGAYVDEFIEMIRLIYGEDLTVSGLSSSLDAEPAQKGEES